MINNLLSTIGDLPLLNIDLLTVGVTIAAIAILGFVVYITNRKSITNKSFLLFCIITILWSFFNYINYQIRQPELVLWLLRIVIFLGVLHSFSFFQFFYVFPVESKKFPKWYKFILIPYVIFVSWLTLSPFVFSGIAQISTNGSVSKTIVEKGIIIFVSTVITLLIVGIVIFVRKIRLAKNEARSQNRIILAGTIVTFALLFTFNLILPGIFLNVRFMPLGALFIFPFIVFTAYAIVKHRLFNVKVITTSLLVFILTVASLIETVYSSDVVQMVTRSSIFILVLAVGISLIKSVYREVEQREKIEVLAKDLEEANKQQQVLMRFITHQVKSFLTKSKYIFAGLKEGDYGQLNEDAKKI